MVSLQKRILSILLFVFLINFTAATIPTCSDSNEIDISDVPCIGFTTSLNCSSNISIFNTTNSSINFSIITNLFTNNIYNFTVILDPGAYEFVDCSNGTATVIIGRFEQGYGSTLFSIIFPSIFLSLISLFVSGRMFSKFRDEDEFQEEHLKENDDQDSFVPRNRLLPIVFMLFAFVPMVFMVGFVSNHLEEYLPGSNATAFYAQFYILFSYLFYFVFLISFVVWLSSYIKLKKMMKNLDAIE